MANDTTLDIEIEVLHETAANLFADFTRYADKHGIPDDDHGPLMTMANQVFGIWQRRGTIKTRQDLDRCEGALDFAKTCLKSLEEADGNGQPA